MSNLNCENRTLFHGDNLTFLRALNSESVDLIATDPPFNKGRDFHATPDSLASGAKFQDRWSWERDVHEEWLDLITDDHPDLMAVIQNSRKTYGDDMGAFLCFMAVRLIEMHRILKPTASIYLHCDPTASHYLKMILDAIFDKRNFRNEIVWTYDYGGRSKKYFPRKHDILLYYSKSKEWVFNFHTLDRIPYKGNIHKYRGDVESKKLGKTPTDVWDIPVINTMSKERVGYPTQKPLALYERAVRASSEGGVRS